MTDEGGRVNGGDARKADGDDTAASGGEDLYGADGDAEGVDDATDPGATDVGPADGRDAADATDMPERPR